MALVEIRGVLVRQGRERHVVDNTGARNRHALLQTNSLFCLVEGLTKL